MRNDWEIGWNPKEKLEVNTDLAVFIISKQNMTGYPSLFWDILRETCPNWCKQKFTYETILVLSFLTANKCQLHQQVADIAANNIRQTPKPCTTHWYFISV